MKRFTRCPICGTSIKTENMSEHIRRVHARDIDSGHGYGMNHPLMTGTKMDLDACDKIHDKAARFIERNKFKKAIKILQKIPKDYPDMADVYSLMAASYAGLERFDDARTYFEKAANDAPWEWRHWYNLAGMHLKNGNVADARRYLNKARAVGVPSDAEDAVDELSEIIAEFLEIVISEKPYLDSETYLALGDRFNRGVAYMEDKDWNQALDEFEYIVSIDEQSEKAYGNLGIVHLFRGEFDEAEMCFNKALEIDPEYPPAAINATLLNTIRDEVAKDPDYLKKIEYRTAKGYF